MKEPKRILILGNGFDLAHFLPTKYEHFLHVMKVIENSNTDNNISFNDLFKKLIEGNDFLLNKTVEIYNTEKVYFSIDESKKLQAQLKDNGWFQYFKEYLDSSINTWIDFENEINNSLKIICNIFNELAKDFIKNIYVTQSTCEIRHIFIKELSALEISILELLNIINIKIPPKSRNRDAFSGLGMLDEQPTYLVSSIFIKKYRNSCLNLNHSEIFSFLETQLNDFMEIFSQYILFIEKLQPKKELKTPNILSKELDCIYSFNYSSTPQNFYQHNNINFLHGKASKNIVLGVSEIEHELLKEYKAFGFAKYYQKLTKKTDYKFLLQDSELLKVEKYLTDKNHEHYDPIYEIYIWGHSLDSSDSDYIKEIFSFNKGLSPTLHIVVYFYDTMNAQLSNLIFIMGKEIIEDWMKKGWLEFIPMPDLAKLNTEEDYIENISKIEEELKCRDFKSLEPSRQVMFV